MNHLTSPTEDLVNAVLASEWDGGEIDVYAIDLVRDGDLECWRDALSDSGLFTDQAIVSIVDTWRRDPEVLVDALLDGADEVSRRRLKVPRRPSLLPVVTAPRRLGFG